MNSPKTNTMEFFNLFLENELPSDINKEVVDVNYDRFKEQLIENIDLTTNSNNEVIPNMVDIEDIISETDFYENALKIEFTQNSKTEFIDKLKDSYQSIIDKFQCITQNEYDRYVLQIKHTAYEWHHEFHQSYESMYGLPPYNPLMN